MKDRIKNLLASGMKTSEVASVVGCSPSYVSQLVKDPEFKASVEALMVANQESKGEEEHLDTRYQNLEHKLITGIEEDIGNSDMKDKLRALEVITKRQEVRSRSKMPVPANPLGSGTALNIHITSIALPAHAIQAAPIVTLNEKNEIIAIDNKPLAPMSSGGVKNIFERMQEKKNIDQKVLTEI